MIYSGLVGAKNTDHQLRERLRAWVIHVRNERLSFGEKNNQIAARIGIPASMLSDVVNGKKTVGVDTLSRLRKSLHLSIDRMFDDDPPNAASPPLRPSGSIKVAGQMDRKASGHK